MERELFDKLEWWMKNLLKNMVHVNQAIGETGYRLVACFFIQTGWKCSYSAAWEEVSMIDVRQS